MSHHPRHQRGTGWQDFGFAVAGLLFWLVIFVGAPSLASHLGDLAESWLPR